MNEQQERISQLELLVMEHERTIDQFGDLLRDQQKQIDELHQQLSTLEQKLTKFSDDASDTPHPFEKPPHY